MNDRERNAKKGNKSKVWLVIGVIVLIGLLLLWVDFADIMGAGDGAAMINLIR